MTIQIPDHVVVFDYGEVISVVPSAADRAALLTAAGAPEPASFWEAYWRHRPALDQAVFTVLDYWRAIERDLGTTWSTAALHRLWLLDFRSWLAVDDSVLDILVDLQRGGTRMAILSNAGLDFASYYRNGMLGQFFERVFTSGEIGLLKPDPAIYEAVTTELGITPGQMVFIDDRAENIASARTLGITGHAYVGAGELRRFLERVAMTSHPTL